MNTSPHHAPGDVRAASDRLHALFADDRRVEILSLARPSDRDSLIVCGVVGAKDVGKSTLINAIADAHVTEPEEEVGEGTNAAMAYVHEADRAALTARWNHAATSSHGAPPLRVVTHRADTARGLVLVDLPDLSSTFADHVRVVRDALPRLDRVIWAWDPLLAGDRAYADRLGPVAKAPDNLYLVITKSDLLARDGPHNRETPNAAWERWRSALTLAVRRTLGSWTNTPDPDRPAADRLFLVCASPEAADELRRRHAVPGAPNAEWITGVLALLRADLDRLRARLMSPLDETSVSRIKQANADAAVRDDARRLIDAYDLDRLTTQADATVAFAKGQIDSVLSDELVAAVAHRLAQRTSDEITLARRVLAARVERWPLLPALYWAGRGVVHTLGRRLVPADDPPAHAPREPARSTASALNTGGVTLADRIDALVSKIRLQSAEWTATLRTPIDYPSPRSIADNVAEELRQIESDLEQVIVAAASRRRASDVLLAPFRFILIWAVLLWFPLLQPIAASIMSAWPETTSAPEWGRLLLSVLRSLSAGSILTGLLLVALLYLSFLSLMFASSVRRVRRVLRGLRASEDHHDALSLVDSVRHTLDEHVRAPLLHAIESRAHPIRAARSDLNKIRSS